MTNGFFLENAKHRWIIVHNYISLRITVIYLSRARDRVHRVSVTVLARVRVAIAAA